jgi:hypothetical protein
MSKKALWLSLPGYRRAVFTKGRIARLPKESKRRKRERPIYNRLAKQFVIDHPKCMRCGKRASCVHHWAGRRSNYLKVETWRSSCHDCNMFAKNHPADARSEGWIAPIGEYLT